MKKTVTILKCDCIVEKYYFILQIMKSIEGKKYFRISKFTYSDKLQYSGWNIFTIEYIMHFLKNKKQFSHIHFERDCCTNVKYHSIENHKFFKNNADNLKKIKKRYNLK